jgi:hypothetical protein
VDIARVAFDPAQLAGGLLGELTRNEQQERGVGFDDAWRSVCKGRPKLFRIANREGGWDALSDLEPRAHSAYLRAVSGENPDTKPRLDEARAAVQAQFPDLRLEERSAKLAELYPDLIAQFRVEKNASDPKFDKLMAGIALDYPELGHEGRWLKCQELYPRAFWHYVLALADAPAP